MWVARDRCGILYIYTDKPKKFPKEGYWYSFEGDYYTIEGGLWPEVSWEDEEPRKLVMELIPDEGTENHH